MSQVFRGISKIAKSDY